jgi:flavin-dependent dehydrogenase
VRTVDFLVLGGGPAGCAFASLAARAGASVILIERGGYDVPRPGEHLAGRIRGALDRLQIPPVTGAMVATSPGILSLWNGAAPLTKPYAAMAEPDALCVVRNRFDAHLFEAAQGAGATTLQQARLVHADSEAPGTWSATVTTPNGATLRVETRSVVDASGRNAIFARKHGSRRLNHGDLFAIVAWLDGGDMPRATRAMLTVESCSFGWWSLSRAADGMLVATLYTSMRMMKSAQASPKAWWLRALQEARRVGRVVRQSGATIRKTAVFPAFPSRSSRMCGSGWIAVGDAAIAFDPLGGRGVALALETAFRAFEAASVDASWDTLGNDYQEALIERFQRHLDGRALAYEEAAGILPEAFFHHAVRC